MSTRKRTRARPAERYYSGDPVRLAGALYALYDKDTPVARIHKMLDELEARQKS